jgi:hypothetical protein
MPYSVVLLDRLPPRRSSVHRCLVTLWMKALIQRVLGLGSYETAWTWLHKLRRAMVLPGRELLAGAVEIDETYVGARHTSVVTSTTS